MVKNGQAKILALILAILVTSAVALLVPSAIDRFNDDRYANITILDKPSLTQALRDVQAKGAMLGLFGYEHEWFNETTPDEAKMLVEKGMLVFQKAGLDFGILYESERNAGNDVRRVGEPQIHEHLRITQLHAASIDT